MKSFEKNNQGMTLIELLVAIFILGIIVVPLFLAFSTSAKTTYRTREIADATLLAENIAEYLIGSDFDTNTIAAVNTGFTTELGGTSSIDITSLTDTNVLFSAVDDSTTTSFVFELEDVVQGTTTLDAKVTLDRSTSTASTINSTLLADSAQADIMFAQSKGAGVTSDPDILSFKDFVSAAKLAGVTVPVTTYDDAALASLADLSENGLTANRTISIALTKDEAPSDTTDTMAEWAIVITYSYEYSYGAFSNEKSYEVISDTFELLETEIPNIQVLFFPWYHGEENIYIYNDNQFNAKDASFNIYLAKQKHTDEDFDLAEYEMSYGSESTNPIDVRLYNEKSIAAGGTPKVYSNIATRFENSGVTGTIGEATSYRIYQLSFFYKDADFESMESLLVETARNRYYDIQIDLSLDGDTASIYQLETSKLQ
ncbi:MAG: prepilin-type N-terminal cleavage/methylation domain-containing protein [Lachnospiraceae bacterium]